MITGETSTLLTALLAILFVIAATLVGALLIVRHWRNQTLADLKYSRSELRSLQNRMKGIQYSLRGFGPDDPEPFRSRWQALRQILADIDRQLGDLEVQNVDIRERAHHLAANRWQATMGAPFFWYQIRKEIGQMTSDRAALQSALAEAESFEQQFTRLSWQVATEAQAVHKIQTEVLQRLDGLRAKNVHGNAMDAISRQAVRIQGNFAEIPRVFFSSDEASVLQGVDKAATASVHQTLTDCRPALEKLLVQIQEGEKSFAAASEKVSAMRQSLGKLEHSLDTMPAGILLNAQKEKLEQLSVVSENLHASLARPELESLGAIAEEAGRVQGAAHELDVQLRQARQQQNALEGVIRELNENLPKLSAQFTALGKNASYPVVWEESRKRLTQLSRQNNTIGQANRPRTIEQIIQDLEGAQQANAGVKELAKHCQEIADQHNELMTLLASPELSQGADWIQTARKLSTQVAQFDPENWPRSENVGSLPQELQALDEGLQVVIGGGQAEAVSETDLPQRLANAREMAQYSKRLRGHIERIQASLADIKQTEENARAQVDGLLTALNQISLLVKSNGFLSGVAAQEIARYQGNLQQMRADLDERARGVVEKKAKGAGALAGRIEASVNGWLDQLNKELEAQVSDLSGALADLEQVGSLDEPAIAQARQLLAQAHSFGPGFSSGGGRKSRFRLEDAVNEFSYRNKFWQECSAAARAIADIEKDLLATFDAASQNRLAAKDHFADLTGWARNKRSWPPTSLTFQNEKQELAQLDEQWEALRQKPNKAITLVAQLGSLAGKYQAFADKLRQMSEQAAREQAQVEDLENELDDLAQRWQGLLQNYRDNQLAVDEIRGLLGKIDQERDQIKQQYRQGSKDYGMSLRSLQTLHRTARLQQIPIDDTHVIDVNGRVIAYR